MKKYPLLNSQIGLFLECVKHPNSTQYNLPVCGRLDDSIDLDRFEDTLQKVISKRAVFKNHFALDDNGNPVQWYDKDIDIIVVKRECTKLEFDDYCQEGFVRPYDILSGEPLVRMEIVSTEKGNYFLCDFHHIIMDGLGFSRFCNKDLDRIYNGKDESFDEAIYGLAEKDQTIFSTEEYARARKFFMNKFADQEFATISNGDGQTLGKMILSYASVEKQLCDDWCKVNDIKIDVLFQMAFCQVMSVLTRQQKIVYGTSFHGRSTKERMKATGMFVNTVAVLADVSTDLTIQELADNLQSELAGSFANAIYPIRQMFLDIHNFPKVIFNFRATKNMQHVLKVGGISYALHELIRDQIQDDMDISIILEDDEYFIRIESSEAMNSQEAIQMMADAIKDTVINIVKCTKDSKVKDLAIVSDEKQNELLSLGKGDELEYNKEATWLDMFMDKASEQPDKVAVVDKSGSYSYAELDVVSDKVAAYLGQQGVVEADHVAIKMGRSKDFISAVIAIHKLGAAYIPIDEDYPQERIDYIVENSKSKLIIDGETVKKSLAIQTEKIAVKAKPDMLAYMIYTSGTTGNPKGVMIPHRAMMNFVNFIRTRWKIDQDSRIVCHSNFAFDASVEDLYPVLTAGGTLYIVPEEERKDIMLMREYIKVNGITGGCYTTQFGQLLGADEELDVDYICLGGEKMTTVPKTRGSVYNTYGPTEFTVDATYYELEADREYKDIPIGRPLDNCYGLIIDKAGRLLPQGAVGELCMAGPQLSLGYWELPEKTAEVFQTVNIAGNEIAIYRTGDLCRYNAEGFLEYFGRIDFQVKLRGFRIEMGEIENRAAAYAGMRHISAQVKKIKGVEHLCLYYTANESVEKRALNEYLESVLPEYMVPTVYMQLDEMPMTPNGKIDRKRLPEPVLDAGEIVAPETEMEEKVASVVAEVLNIDADDFGVTNNLISLGMSSLVAMRLATSIRKALGYSIRVADIMKDTTVRGIAEILSSGNAGNKEIKHYDLREYYPLTENQRGVYIDWEMNHDTTQYNIPLVYKLKDKEAEKLVQAVRIAFDAHSYLKTTFVQLDDVMQKVNSGADVDILVSELPSEPEKGFFQAKIKPFDLLQDRLYRIEIYQYNEDVYLFMDIHHMLIDGMSSAVLLADILAAYDGVEIRPEEVTSYDMALHEKELHESEEFAKAEAYFAALADGAEAVAYPSSSQPDGTKIGYAHLNIPTKDINAVCNENGITVNAYFQAVLAEVLGRISREEKIMYLTISNGRSSDQLDRTVGMFVKTLPVAVKIDKEHGKVKVADYCKAMHEQLQKTYELDFYPYTAFVEKHKLNGQIMFAYQGGMEGNMSGVEEIEVALDTAKLPMIISVFPRGDEYMIHAEYDGMRYERKDIDILLNAIVNASISMAKAEKIRDIELVDDKERTELLALGCGPTLERDQSETILDIFKSRVSKTPDAVALVFHDKVYTYSELDKITDRLAVYLHKNYKISTEDNVGILINRSEMMLILPLAVLKNGAAYMPLDPHFPTERLSFMCEDAEVKLIISEGSLLQEKLPDYGGGHFNCDEIGLLPDVTAEEVAGLHAPSAHDRLVIIFTSGSTGKPKAVDLEHYGVVNYCHWYAQEFALTEQDRVAGYANFGFDAHMIDLYPSILAGSAVYLFDEAMRMDVSGMNAYMEDNKISVAFMTTQVGCIIREINHSLRYLSTGGEKMPPVTPPDFRFLNVYGPTECSLFSTYYDVKGYFEGEYIGYPLANYQLYVIDSNGNMLPKGIAGELLIAGQGVARGYMKRPELTAEKFIMFRPTPDSEPVRAYRSGDLVRWSENDGIQFLGRIDKQVKLRGLRIELGEIENRAAGFAGIKQIIVDVKHDQLCCYYVAEQEIDKAELKAYLAETLTEFMVPEVYIQLDVMPLNPNGKVDRKLLPEPEVKLEEIEAPATDREREIFAIMTELLQKDSFGVTNNLVSVGMSSLVAMRLSVMLNNRLGKQVKVAEIMKHPTIRELAIYVESGEGEADNLVEHIADREYYPITENQRGIYIDWEMNRETTQYNIPSVYKFKDKDAEKLAAAMKCAIDAHGVLKTRFALIEDDIMQVPHYEEEAVVSVTGLNEEPDAGFFQERVRAFDLFNDHLYRAEIYVYDEAVYLFLDIHHIIYDGMSTAVLLNDVFAVYDGKGLQEEEITAYDLALYEKNVSASEDYKKAEEYFNGLVTGATVASYPDSKVENGVNNGVVEITIPSKAIEDAVRSMAVTVSSYMNAAFAQTLHRVVREDKIMYLTISNGREVDIRLTGCVGMFVKTLPVVFDGAGHKDDAVADMVQACHLQLQDTIEKGFYPYTKLVEDHQIKGEIMFVYQGDVIDDKLLSQAELIPLELDTAKLPITITIFPKGDTYLINIEYDGMRYTEKDMLVLAKALADTAMSMTTAASVKDICMVDAATAKILKEMGTGPVMERDESETILDIFKKRVEETPDALALVFHERRYTYRELDEITDRLAVYFKDEYALEHEDNVGVLINRSELMLIYPLAIMKNGAAYMPLDPHFPTDRLTFMCEDAEVKVILSEGNLLKEKLPDFAGKEFNSEAIAGLPEVTAEAVVELRSPKAHDRLVIIFTSGSTGKPKAVDLEHYGVVNYSHWYADEFELTPDDHVAGYANFGFDAHMIDFYPSILAGSAIYIFDEAMRMDIPSMNDYMEANDISVAFMTTQIGCIISEINHSLRYLSTGGEKMPPVTPPDFRFLNVYGPTECSLFSTFYDVKGYFEGEYIGYPLSNYQLYVIDQYNQLVGKGMAGELLIAGQGVARGYMKRPELTAEKFIMFRSTPDSDPVRAYRSGDLVRWSENDGIQFLGRIDKQVKLRGLRIELGEIENRVSQFPDIKQVSVDVKKDRLCCYYVADKEIDKESLKEHLAEKLTDFMIPEVYIKLDALPLNPNGKVDKKALPEPEMSSTTEYVEPATKEEKCLALAMEKVLGLKDKVGALDNFFELGGDSIKAIRIISMLRQEDMNLKVADIMKLKVVRKIAEAVSKNTIEISQEPYVGQVMDSAIVRFFMNLELPVPHHFNQSTQLRLRERGDIDLLQQAINAVTYQHDMLRAVVKDNALWTRAADIVIPIEEYTVSDLADSLAICQKMQTNINMADSLVRIALIHGPESDYLFMVAHHLIVDGVSWRIITGDLEMAYGQLLQGEKISLPLKTHAYNDYAKALKDYRDSFVLSLELPYWQEVQKKLLAGATSKEKDYSREMDMLTVVLDKETTAKCIKANFGAINGDVNDALMTAVCRSYHAVTGEDTVSVQFEGHGRENIGSDIVSDRTVGWFTSIYPVVVEGLQGDMHKDLLHVKETMHRLPNKGVGYNILRFIEGEAQEEFKQDDIAKIGFNYLGEMDVEQDTGSFFMSTDHLQAGEDFSREDAFGTDISINCSVEQGEFGMSFAYNKAVLSKDKAQSMLEGIVEEMKAVAEHLAVCEKTVTASDMGENEWSEEEFEHVIDEFAARGEKVQRIYPLSYLQEGMLFKHISEPESWAYRLVSVFTMDKLPTEAQLAHALERLGKKHEVLRTAIIYDGVKVPRQAIVERDLSLTMLDYSQLEDKEAAVGKYREEILSTGYDLQKKPLFALTCIKIDENSCYMVMITHHIIVDGWCLGIYTNDLLNFINEELTGEFTEDALPDEGKYEAAIREILHHDKKKGLQYWHDLLDGYGDIAEIPSFETVPKAEQSSVYEVRYFVPSEVANKLNELCQAEEVTINCGIEMAWGLLLQVYKRSKDVVFAKVVSGRDNTEVDVNDLVGLFINTIPVRMKCEASTTVRQLLRSLQKQSSESSAYDFCPLAEIQDQTELNSNLFQTIIAFENYDSGQETSATNYCFEFKPLIVKEENIDSINPSMYLMDDGSLCLNISFDVEKYRMWDIEKIGALFEELLTDAVNDPDKPIAELSRLGKADMDKVIQLSAGEKMEYDATKIWLDMFKEQVKARPSSVAVVDSIGSLTYAELDGQSDTVAAYLSSKGVKEGNFIVVKMGRVKEFLLAVIALHKIGAAYVPIDNDYPEERINYIAENSRSEMIVTSETIKEALSSGIAFEKIDIKATPDHLAYMIYTSGSTGKPKGVMIPHKAMMNFVNFIRVRWDIDENSRIACHSNFAFDASVEDLYPALIAGGTMFIVPDAERKDIFLMREYIIKNNINGGCYTTQFGQLLCSEEELDLNYICVGGEKMTAIPKVTGHVYNTYGPTEFTVDATYFELDKSTEYKNIPIGRPLYNCSAFILDQYDNLLPNGLVGELCMAGPQLSRGYWELPEKTAEVFKTIDIGGKETAIYRTGDLARYNHEGFIEYFGRIDFQVKLRGFRIELGEVESRAMEYADCKVVNAQVKNDQLVLYYSADCEVDKKALREFLSKTLADYMVPTIYMQLDEMPLTPNGKVNTKVLPEPDISEGLENVPPETYLESEFLRIAKEMLPGIEFGVTDDLMYIGMSSIMAMKYVSKLQSIKKNVRVSDLMRYRNIRELIKGNVRMFWFYDEDYDESKPLLVFVQGIVNVNATMPKFIKWSEYFNIMVIEPVDDHYYYLFKGEGFDEVVEMYHTVINLHMPLGARPFAFMGYSYGGEIAACLAKKWSVENGEKIAVVMGDTHFNINDENIKEILINAYDEHKKQGKVNAIMSSEELEYKNKIVDMIEQYEHTEFTGYDGKAIFLKAGVQQLGVPEKVSLDNLKYVQGKFSDLEVIEYEGLNHDDLYIKEDLIDGYTEILLRLAKGTM